MSSLTRSLQRQRALIVLAACFLLAAGTAVALALNTAAPSAGVPAPASVDRQVQPTPTCSYRPQIRLASARSLPVVRADEPRGDARHLPTCADTVSVPAMVTV